MDILVRIFEFVVDDERLGVIDNEFLDAFCNSAELPGLAAGLVDWYRCRTYRRTTCATWTMRAS